MKDNLYLVEEARPRMMNGIRRVANAVGITMGTSGRNSDIECIESPGWYPTNDGWSIANSIRFEDPLEEHGRRKLIEAINRANKSSGDGSSTTCVLTAAILEEGMKHLEEASPMEIKRSLDACIPIIEESINKQKREISVEDVWKVAAISAEDEEIGKRIGEIYSKIGKEGVINWDISKTPEDYYEIGTGIKIDDAGYITPYLNDVDTSTGWFKNEARLKDVPVILCAQKLTNLDAIGSQLALLNDKGHSECLIFVDETTPEVIGQLIATRQQKGFRAVLAHIPTLYKDEWWEDLSLASGATVLSNAIGVPINSIQEEHIGTFGNVIVNKDSVIVDGTKDLKKHILALQVQGEDASLARAFRLNLKTARYFVGGHSESSIAYRRLKIEDAINAASEALDGGVVAGGGSLLLNIASSIDASGNHTVGNQILSIALQIPFEQIVKNAGIVPSEQIKIGYGYDTKNGEYVDMFDAGIIDPAKVVLSAVKAAIGVASGVLTLGTVVLLPREEPKQTNQSLIQR